MQIDADGRSWSLMVDLLQRYDLTADWDGDQRRVLIAASDVAPTYRDDAVQAAVGWPLVEMALQGDHRPTGIEPGAGCWSSPRNSASASALNRWCWGNGAEAEVQS